MTSIRSARLELLRHGPPHNQLLSPLTPYLALAGNQESQSLQLPFEHREFLLHHRALRYQEPSLAEDPGAGALRQARLGLLAEKMGQVLGAVPGLAAELKAAEGAPGILHLRLIFSASELALLPWELARAPAGCPGAGRPLALQTQAPVCITREVRHASGRVSDWTRRPKILFAFSEAGGAVPHQQHLDALLAALRPWLRSGSAAARVGQVKGHLRLCPEASLEALEGLCREEPFTHIHLLAHGGELDPSAGLGGTGYGLVLRDADGSPRTVDGRALAGALFGWRNDASCAANRPNLVTLASCDSGNPGNLLFPDVSLAHTLHEEGVPLVVGSQYPLSFAGSLVLVETLYGRLLWGADPRMALHDLRMRLSRLEGGRHDWASLVAYSAFPEGFDRQVRTLLVRQVREARRNAITEASWCIERSQGAGPTGEAGLDLALERLTHSAHAVGLTRERDEEVRADLLERVRTLGDFAGVEKRRAELLFRRAARLPGDSPRRSQLLRESGLVLEKARELYRRAAELDRANPWVGTQHLALTFLAGEPLERRRWEILRLAAELQAGDPRPRARIWAAASLAELHLLALSQEWGARQAKVHEQALEEQVLRIVQGRPAGSYETQVTLFQFRRYADWWPVPESLQALGRRVVGLLEEGGRAVESAVSRTVPRE